MNCRTVKLMAVAIALCAISAMASHAVAADKAKTKYGSIVSITAPVAASGKTAATPGSIKIKDKDGTETSYEISDSVTVKVKGEDAKLEDLKEGDKIRFTLTDDGKIATINKGRKKKAPAA